MKKLKIYLDTSVISHLKQDDAPDKTQDTLKLWEDIKQGSRPMNRYDIVSKAVVILERLIRISRSFLPISPNF